MKKKLLWAWSLLTAFVLWTVLICTVDVQPVGPNGSSVGLAAINSFVHAVTGVHWDLYTITDWLGLVPVGFGMAFAIAGLCQWIRRGKLNKVDADLFVLGGFYLAVLAAYLLFEKVVINYRPVLIGTVLEVSYPSSTTMLALCVLPTAILQLRSRIAIGWLKILVNCMLAGLTGFMVVGRLLSGVHWVSDIVGGILLSGGLVMLYWGMTELCKKP